jgi:hypothetical protein
VGAPTEEVEGKSPGKALSNAAWFGFVAGLLAALPAFLYLRGFTVDDALIPARYASNIAHGWGYRFNALGPSTDGVTPLGFPYLLAPFASKGPLSALFAARVMGAFAWLAAAAALGGAVAQIRGSPWRYASLLLVVFSAPLGAWAWAGLETGIVVALSTAAAVLPLEAASSPWAGAALGACAWLRPEMIAYATWLGGARVRAAGSRRRMWLTAALVGVPWVAAALLRWFTWGRPAPLAVLSKPSDLAHGAAYVLPAVLFAGAPLAALAPIAWAKLPGLPRSIVAGAFVHLAVVLLAGGDWMPLARLVCPVLPPLALATAHLLSSPSTLRMAAIRLCVGCIAETYVFASRGPAAAHVLHDRIALIDWASPRLAGIKVVAAVDVGWVGTATDAEIVDLAGATDPEIAALPGGHTSKAFSGSLVMGRGAGAIVLQLAPHRPSGETAFARVIETRLFNDDWVKSAYRMAWQSPVSLPVRYIILTRTPIYDGPRL